jgi:hypothetical protein
MEHDNGLMSHPPAVDELPRRSRKWRWGVGGALLYLCLLALVIGCGVMIWQIPFPDRFGPPTASCSQGWANGERGPLPPLQFTSGGIEVYADDHGLFVCDHDPAPEDTPVMLTYDRPPWMDELPPGRVGYLVSDTQAGLLFGTVPPGADRVNVRSDRNSQVVAADVHDGYFVFRATDAVPLSSIVDVEAIRADRLLASGPPALIFGRIGGASLDRFCAALVRDSATPVLGPAGTADLLSHPITATLPAELGQSSQPPTVVFASRTALAGCVLDSQTKALLPRLQFCCLLRHDPLQRSIDAAVFRSDLQYLVVGFAPQRTVQVTGESGNTGLGPGLLFDTGESKVFVFPASLWSSDGPIVITAYDRYGNVVGTGAP